MFFLLYYYQTEFILLYCIFVSWKHGEVRRSSLIQCIKMHSAGTLILDMADLLCEVLELNRQAWGRAVYVSVGPVAWSST